MPAFLQVYKHIKSSPRAYQLPALKIPAESYGRKLPCAAGQKPPQQEHNYTMKRPRTSEASSDGPLLDPALFGDGDIKYGSTEPLAVLPKSSRQRKADQLAKKAAAAALAFTEPATRAERRALKSKDRKLASLQVRYDA